MKLRILAIALISISLQACGGASSDTETSAMSATISGRWPTTPVTLAIAPEIARDTVMMEDVREAASFWENAARKSLFILDTNYSGPVPPISGTYTNPTNISANLLFFVDPWPMEQNIKGHTILQKADNAFQHGVIYLKLDSYCYGPCEAASNKISFRRLVAHELGHFIGIPHTSSATDIMYPTIPIGAPLSQATYPHPALEAAVF